MTDEEALKKRVADLEDKVERLRSIIIQLIDHERKETLSESRRLKNIILRDEQAVKMFEDLAASVT